jgi:hypothetical protein
MRAGRPRLELPTDYGTGQRTARADGLDGPGGGIASRRGSPKKKLAGRTLPEIGQGVGGGGVVAFFILGEEDDGARRAWPLRARSSPSDGLHAGGIGGRPGGLRGYVGTIGHHHLAAAWPAVVALFGPSNPENWGPRGTRVTILRARRVIWRRLPLKLFWRRRWETTA